MELANRFDVTDQVFEDEPTKEREQTYPPNSELLMSLQRDMATCNHGEQQAMRVILDKLIAGRVGKGPLDPVNDPRDWNAELRSELTDALWYLAFQVVREGAQ